MYRICLVFLLAFTGMASTKAVASTLDSLRLETIDGQTYIIHQVDPGETLYAISKRYHCSMNAIAGATPDVKRGLHDGMILRVPYNPNNKPKEPGKSVHIVKAGETLYSISRIYNVSVIDIMEWNDLMSADLEIDQKLTIKGQAVDAPVDYVLDGMRIHVVQAGEGLYAIARQYEVTVDELVEWNELTSSALNLGQEVIVGKVDGTDEPVNKESIVEEAAVTTAVALETVKDSDPVQETVTYQPEVENTTTIADSAEVNYAEKEPVLMMQKKEDGLAAAIDGGSDTNTFLAMHRTAPVGSLVAVRNEMNNQVVFVRVIGALPDTGVNDKIIVRLSAAAVEQLRAIDPKFRVEITYLVPEE